MKISVEEVREAYRQIGYTPIRNITVADETKQCCVLAALCMQETGNEYVNQDTREIFQWAYRRYGEDYCRQLVVAFDTGYPYLNPDEETNEGSEDGLRIRQAMENDYA